jgi:hypothetical protein
MTETGVVVADQPERPRFHFPPPVQAASPSVADNVTALVASLFEQLSQDDLISLGLALIQAIGGNFGPLQQWLIDQAEEGLTWLTGLDDWAVGLANLTDLLASIQGIFAGATAELKTISDLLSLRWLQADGTESDLAESIHAIIQAIRGIEVPNLIGAIGDLFEEMFGLNKNVEAADSKAVVAQNQITTIAQVFLVQTNRPLWEGVDPTGEATLPHATLRAGDVVTINATTSRWGILRCELPVHKTTATFMASRTGTVDAFYIDVYRMLPDGSYQLHHSSANLAGTLLPNLAWQQVAYPEFLVELGESIALQFRMSGSGSVSIAGASVPAPASLPGFLPKHFGAVRTASNAPATITAAQADSFYSGSIPFVQFGSDVGQINAPRNIFDDFNRGALGPNWALTTNGGNNLTVASNRMANPSTQLAGQASAGIYILPMSTDKVNVDFDLTNVTSMTSGVMLCCRGDFTNFLYVAINATTVYLFVCPDLNSQSTQVASGSFSDNTRRWRASVADGVFSVFPQLQDGSTGEWYYPDDDPTVSWVNDGSISTGPGNRFCGAVIEHSGFTTGSPIDNWNAYDVIPESETDDVTNVVTTEGGT